MNVIRLVLFLCLLIPSVGHPQTRRAPVSGSESPAEGDRREGERIMRAYFDERLLQCGGSWWWVERYQSCGRGGCSIDNKLHQGKGNMRFIFDGRYTPPRTLSMAEKLNGVDPQPVEFEGTMWVIFEAARCANCTTDRGWLGGDSAKVGMTISKRHGKWLIAEFSDPYNSLRKPTCANNGNNILSADEHLTPKTRFNGDYQLKGVENERDNGSMNSSTPGVTVPAIAGWVDTGTVVKAGERITFDASGLVSTDGGTPNTDPNGYAPAVCAKPDCFAPGVPYGALVGRIGDVNPFRVGASLELTARSSGRLYLSVNDNSIYLSDNKGSFTVHITKR